jgi:hypothetical protein
MLTSSWHKSYTGVGNPVFNSVEAQTMLTWIKGTENLTRLTVKPQYNDYPIMQNIKFFSNSNHIKYS